MRSKRISNLFVVQDFDLLADLDNLYDWEDETMEENIKDLNEFMLKVLRNSFKTTATTDKD